MDSNRQKISIKNNMKNERYISLKEIEKYSEKIPFKVLKASLTINTDMTDGVDYVCLNDDVYVCLETAMFIIGRFALTDYKNLTPIIKTLALPRDKYLPQLTPAEQEWHDKILKNAKFNAGSIHVEFEQFMSAVYTNMNVDFHKRIKDYRIQCGNPDTGKISKFDITTRNKDLRILFENCMSKIMTKGKIDDKSKR